MMTYPRPLPKFTICPECNLEAIERVDGDYKTEDGSIIERLERWQCSACHADFFDIEAMHRLVSEGKPRRARRSAIQPAMEKTHA